MQETRTGIFGRFPFAPALKLPSRETYDAALNSGAAFVVVRLQDLLAKGGKAFKPLFQQIKNAGGLHAHLKYSGRILLSFVMRNRLLAIALAVEKTIIAPIRELIGYEK